ncbi:hypothetical protein ACA910_018333 [Epithemia clementina (nom. ined.)]
MVLPPTPPLNATQQSSQSVVDQLVNRLPGSMTAKAFGTALAITILAGIPYFIKDSTADRRQGHQFFSSEKPEAIIAQQEQARKQYLLQQQQQQQQS